MVEKRFVFLFPGQGAQYPGMGLDFYDISPAAREIFSIASETLSLDMVSLIRDSDAEKLRRTDVSQIALTAASLAAAARLKEKGFTPSICAGFSLGEYPALACAGVIGAGDCFTLVQARGRAMQAAVDRISGGADSAPGMAAVLGLPPEQVEGLIAEWEKAGSFPGGLYAANINSPKQTVVSGTAPALAEAEKRFKKAGARRFIRLEVAGPFHSPFMKEAAEAFAPALEKVAFKDPEIALFSNVTGNRVQSGAEAKSLALRQICEGVRWTDEEAALAAFNPDAVFEAGPGKVLQGLWRDTGSKVPCRPAGTVDAINELTAEN
ncbi:MAG: ACP S-malonyltransferase [Treponema sp.]|jgi:[acyl-carrier-protein] S-malonyltransferase|nr:ACP S-malonyltransferase [Treponema sp.]